MKKNENFSVVNLTREEVPIVTEDLRTRYSWIPVGIHGQDDYFDLLTEAYNTSTTNAACIEGIADLIFGKGLCTKDEEFKQQLSSLIPSEDLRRVSFDLKLYGQGAFQVMWNEEHTEIKKMYHIPVQTLRAKKLHDMHKVEGYFYCQDWNDQRKQKQKKYIPSFNCSDEEMEILYVKEYEPNRFYYSLPDWISALQYSFSEAELSNLHLNNIENGFLPVAMVNFNNGVPAPEERDTIEALIESKFTGTKNAGRFMVSFNDDAINKPTIDTIPIDNLHDKYTYVAEYAQDRILVAHRIVSPLLFGIRTTSNGFSSAAEEMKTAYSIMQTMTIFPFQNLLLNSISEAFKIGGIGVRDLYFEQLTPLVILTDTADDTDQTIDEAQKDVDDTMQSEETTEEDFEGVDEAIAKVQETISMKKADREPIRFSEPFFDKNYI